MQMHIKSQMAVSVQDIKQFVKCVRNLYDVNGISKNIIILLLSLKQEILINLANIKYFKDIFQYINIIQKNFTPSYKNKSIYHPFIPFIIICISIQLATSSHQNVMQIIEIINRLV